MSTQKGKWIPELERPSLAIKRLDEVLKEKGVDYSFLNPKRIEKAHKILRKTFPDIAERTLGEIIYSSDTGAVAKVLDVVFDAATPRLVDRQICQVITKDAPSIKVLKGAKAVAGWIAESGNIPISEEDYSSPVTITAMKSGCRPVISKDAIEDADFDIVERQLREGARAMADFEDNVVVDALTAGVTTNTFAAASAGTLAWADVAKMIGTMEAVDYHPDTLVVNPSEIGDLMKDSNFLNLILYGKQGGVNLEGALPIAYMPGFKVWGDSNQASGTALVLDSKAAAVLFIRRDITMEEYDDVVNDLWHAVFTARWYYGIIDEKAMGTITAC